MKRTTFLAAIIVASTAIAAFAHGKATGIVKERMEAMETMGDGVKVVAAMMRGERAYDADLVRGAAKTFQAHSGSALTKLFPEGSGGEPSEAKPEIWTDWETFSALADQLGTYSDGLARAADNGLMASQGTGMGAGSMMGNGAGMTGSGTGMMGTGSGMMGGSGAGLMTAEEIAAMPADGAFNMVSQVCSACHTRFRAESD